MNHAVIKEILNVAPWAARPSRLMMFDGVGIWVFWTQELGWTKDQIEVFLAHVREKLQGSPKSIPLPIKRRESPMFEGKSPS
jgi:hypothetical protein